MSYRVYPLILFIIGSLFLSYFLGVNSILGLAIVFCVTWGIAMSLLLILDGNKLHKLNKQIEASNEKISELEFEIKRLKKPKEPSLMQE